jgi:uncharacterized membrane protein YkvA (DUF1232 family)
MNYNINELDEQYNSEEKVERGSAYVQDNLFEKVEKAGSKIRFAKDVKALYRYMRDRHVPWYRKSIVVGALIYFISPIDAIPDLAPLIGYLDDLGVIAAVLKFMGSEIIPYYD